MKLTDSQREKLNDFKNAYMQIFNKDNNEHITLIINTIFENIEKNYEEFSDDIGFIPIGQENDRLNIIKPENGHYSLLDFLLNRLFKNIQKLDLQVSGNGYAYQNKELQILISRYDKYYGKYNANGARSFSDDFLYHQRIKSIMHESGHALQNKRECDNFLERTQLIGNQLSIILSQKYNLNEIFENVSKKYLAGPFGSNSVFGEGLNEMYASLHSGILNYSLRDRNLQNALINQNQRIDFDGRRKTSFRRNCFNVYQQYKYFFLIRALVSKRSIFYSMYFGRNDMIDEFCNAYKDIISKHEESADASIKERLLLAKSNNFFVSLLQITGVAYNNQYGLEEVCKYEKILDSIFIEAITRRINSLTAKDGLLQSTLGNIYSDSYVYIENGSIVDSEERKKYLELYQKVALLNNSLPDAPQKSGKVLVRSYGVFDVNVINNPNHNMKIIIYLRNGEFEVKQIEFIENNDFNIMKDENSICKLIERYLNEHKQELIDNPMSLIQLLNNINAYIPKITVSKSNIEFGTETFGTK